MRAEEAPSGAVRGLDVASDATIVAEASVGGLHAALWRFTDNSRERGGASNLPRTVGVACRTTRPRAGAQRIAPKARDTRRGRSYHRAMSMWRCPHCGTPQAETARCWVCRRSSTTCSTCRNFRRSVAAQLGYCGLDRRRLPLAGTELRGCWEAASPRQLEAPPRDSPPPTAGPGHPAIASPVSPAHRLRDFVPVELTDRSGRVIVPADADGPRPIRTDVDPVTAAAAQAELEPVLARTPPGPRVTLFSDGEL